MPRGDGTGPYGQGPGTGRGLGRGGGRGRMGTAPGQVPRGIVFVLAVEQRCLIRQVFLAMMQVVLSAGQK
jgi:hypothetical protein